MIIAALYPCPFAAQFGHDANAAVIKDGRIYAYEEEKLNQTKHDGISVFAERSLMLGFKELGVLPSEVDRWVFIRPKVEPGRDTMHLLFTGILKAYSGPRDAFDAWYDSKVSFVGHHTAHASVAVHASGFPDCAFVSVDGGGDVGDHRHTVWGEYDGKRLVERGSMPGYNGIASFHSYLTDAMGFYNRENGKCSGLAAYGKVEPELAAALNSVLELKPDGILFRRERYGATSPNLRKAEPLEYNREKVLNTYPSDTNILRATLPYLPQDIAATGEHVFRDMFMKFLASVRARTEHKRVVFSGGLFQNVALNRAILYSGLFEDYYFPMASADPGLALGAALDVLHRDAPRPAGVPLTAGLGPSFDADDIRDLLDRFRLHYAETDRPAEIAAELIANGKIVGWFQGRGEYGPRSLGARSILADPRDVASTRRVNQMLKRREWFMPYAPAVMEEHLAAWFTPPHPSPYMQVALDLKPGKRELIPAAVHVDGTSRAQVVSRRDNPAFWRVIDRFRELTGLPVVLNTSFNRHGIPTISSPRQAIEHLLEGCMDALVIDRFVIDFAANRSVGPQQVEIKSDDEMLVADALDRLDTVVEHGTPEQIAAYLERLSALLKRPIALRDDVLVETGGKERVLWRRAAA